MAPAPGESARYGASARTRKPRGPVGSSEGVSVTASAANQRSTPLVEDRVSGGDVATRNYSGGGGTTGGSVASGRGGISGDGHGNGIVGSRSSASSGHRSSNRHSSGGSTYSTRSTESSSTTGRQTTGASIPQIGLREIVYKRIIEDVFHSSMEKFKGWMVCVVDDAAMRVMSSVMGMYDLMEQRVSLVEALTKKRAPFPDLGVIYVCAPTVSNVETIVNDFMPTDGKKQPLYGNAVFIYFLSKVPKEVFSKLKVCKPLIKRLKALGEINVDFLAKQSRAFHFDMIRSMPDLYRREGVFNLTHNSIIEKLVTLCATLNEYPHVRYPVACPLSQNLAETFQSKMNEFVASAPNWWYYGMSGHTERDRSTLLLVDRSMDPLTPLMHEFTYQAMVYDLLDIQDDKISYKADVVKAEAGDTQVESVAKDVLLNDNDELWVELRGRHIADVIQTLSTRIKEVVNSNTGAKLAAGDGANLSLSQMATALKALPEYQEVMSKLSQHMHISHQCMSVFNKQNLLELAELEQTLATGVDEDHRSVKFNDMLDSVEEMLHQMSPTQAVRLLAVFLASQETGTPEPAKNRLYAAASLTPEQERGLQNLEKLGVTIDQRYQSNAERMKTLFGSGKKKVELQLQDDSEYATSRYIPKIKPLLTALAENTLDLEIFPSVMPMPIGSSGSAASVRTKTNRKGTRFGDKKKGGYSGPRIITFIAGGASFSEIKCAAEVMAACEREVIIGSTSFIKPDEYLRDLLML